MENCHFQPTRISMLIFRTIVYLAIKCLVQNFALFQFKGGYGLWSYKKQMGLKVILKWGLNENLPVAQTT